MLNEASAAAGNGRVVFNVIVGHVLGRLIELASYDDVAVPIQHHLLVLRFLGATGLRGQRQTTARSHRDAAQTSLETSHGEPF